MKKTYAAVVIGVSAGGLNALSTIFSHLATDFMMSVIVVQHTHSTSDDFLPRHLNEMCSLRVKQADEKEIIQPGAIYIAPVNYHLLIETDKTFSLSVDELVNFARPSIDVLFESAADAYGSRLVGMILTGANVDGSYGLKVIKEVGGLAIVQDPDTAEAAAMPRAAMAAAAIDHILPLEKISPFLNFLDAESKELKRIKNNG
jgi:two-component system chemotaxis response regulator CheB